MSPIWYERTGSGGAALLCPKRNLLPPASIHCSFSKGQFPCRTKHPKKKVVVAMVEVVVVVVLAVRVVLAASVVGSMYLYTFKDPWDSPPC